MEMEQICVVFLSLIALTSGAGGDSFSYTGAKAAANWPTLFVGKCDGKTQSPIDLKSELTTFDPELKKFSFTNFDTAEGVAWELQHAGHSINVYPTAAGKVMKVEGGSLGDMYHVWQFHFHWGSVSSQGSEHTVDGLEYPMEMHIVTYNNRYPGPGEAVTANQPNSLAVLGFFFTISPEDNPQFQSIVDGISNIPQAGNKTSINAKPLVDIMQDTKDYFRYQGGLTTPACNQIVTWTVFRNPITISEKQMNVFRTLLDVDGKNMYNNYRPPQPLHGRSIRASFTSERFASSASSLAFTASLTLVSAIMAAVGARM